MTATTQDATEVGMTNQPVTIQQFMGETVNYRSDDAQHLLLVVAEIRSAA